MPEYKVLIADKLDPIAAEVLAHGGAVADDRAGISTEELLAAIPEYHALIVRSRSKATADLIAAGNQLKVIGRAGVGIDNIDLEAAEKAGVAVVNTPVSTSVAVAEHTFALLLALLHRVPAADASMKAGGWPKKDLVGAELAGKTLGILGVGNIGAQVARRAAAFDMNVLGYDPLLDDDTVKLRGAQPVPVDELYLQSDVITLHLPLTNDTRGLLDAEVFAKMKAGVFLVCAARGGVIDEDALLAALNSGQVAGAALDVYATEPPGASDLVVHPHVVATPHIGGQTAEAQVRAARDVAEEVLLALNDQPLRWRVV
jgi:D-3-phosphoglycerate dehydrogenase